MLNTYIFYLLSIQDDISGLLLLLFTVAMRTTQTGFIKYSTVYQMEVVAIMECIQNILSGNV